MKLPAGWQKWAQTLRTESRALYLASRDPRVPWYGKLVAALVVAYALSPMDLIPDFIPLLGYLDDLILIPLGIWLALKLIPPEVLAECRAQAKAEFQSRQPGNKITAGLIILCWILVLGTAGYFLAQAGLRSSPKK